LAIELRLLAEFVNTNTASTGLGKAPNTQWSPPPVTTVDPALPQGMLDSNQLGEVAFLEIISPVDAQGNPQDLHAVTLVLDNKPVDENIWISGRDDTNMAPRRSRVWGSNIYSFGKSVVQAMKEQNAGGLPAWLTATCPKFTSSVSVECTAGATAITENYRVRIWGYAYTLSYLATAMPSFGGVDAVIKDQLNSRTLPAISKGTIFGGNDWSGNWASLPAGLSQGMPSIWPMIRFAANAVATSAGQPYIYQFQNSAATPGVTEKDQNLYFNLGANEALVIRGLGIKAVANQLSAWVQTKSQAQTRHPAGGIPAGFYNNDVNFGAKQGISGAYDAIPRLADVVIWNEIAYPTTLDSGISIPSSVVPVIAITALHILYSGSSAA
jgi:hypothetical protein